MRKGEEMEKEFQFENKTYKIVVDKTNDGYKVYVTLGGERINPYVYGIEDETRFDFIQQNANDPIQHLMSIAESDVRNKSWEKLQKIEASIS